MTEKELAEIRSRIAEERKAGGSRIIAVGLYTIAYEDAPKLLDEVERLRTVLQEINDWCFTDDGAYALPTEPPWAKAMQAALDAAGGAE